MKLLLAGWFSSLLSPRQRMALRSGIRVYSDALHKTMILDAGPTERRTASTEAHQTRPVPASDLTKSSSACRHSMARGLGATSRSGRGTAVGTETVAEGRQVRGNSATTGPWLPALPAAARGRSYPVASEPD